jgi:pimeloyl-ACP methyl ester carboxylesterase
LTVERWTDLVVAGTGPSRREVLDIPSARGDLRAVLHGDAGSASAAVVLCPAWGDDGARLRAWSSLFADEAAARGLAVLRFAWPGTFHSGGDDRAATLPDLADACLDATGALRSRAPGRPLVVVGLRLGGAALALALDAGLSVDAAVLVQPVFDGRALAERRLRVRTAVAGPADGTLLGWVDGEPWPDAIAQDVTPAAQRGIAAAAVPTTVVRYRNTPVWPASTRVTVVPGSWHDEPRLDHRRLRRAAVRATQAAGR